MGLLDTLTDEVSVGVGRTGSNHPRDNRSTSAALDMSFDRLVIAADDGGDGAVAPQLLVQVDHSKAFLQREQ
jgi:hypothetical protein